jgi:hypothetical protein
MAGEAGKGGNPGGGGDPSAVGGGGGGGGGGVGFSLTWSKVKDVLPGWLADNLETLEAFLTGPIRFLRGRLIPPVLGAIFGFTFDVAAAVASPFQIIISSLQTVNTALENALTVAVFVPLSSLFSTVISAVIAATAPLGPLQPFAIVAVFLIGAYVLALIASRTLRAGLDAVPGLSGVETLLFG